MRSNEPHYLPADHVRYLLQKAESVGLSAQVILRDCHQSYSACDIFESRISALPQQDFVMLRNTCIVQIWTRVSERYNASLSNADFRLYCHSLISSLTLAEVIDRTIRFFNLLQGKAGRFALEVREDRAYFIINANFIGAEWRFFFQCNAYSTFFRLFEWLIGEELHAECETAAPGTDDNRYIATIFGECVRFGAPRDQFGFSAGLLNRPVIRSSDELHHFLRRFPFDNVVRQLADGRLAPRIVGMYRTAVARGGPIPTIGELAQAVHVSPATLRRRLDEEETSVHLLKETVRRELSLQFLRDRQIPLNDIAVRLGFSGSRSFGRAFHDWNGTSPSDYRRQTGKKSPLSDVAVQVEQGVAHRAV